MRPNIETQRLRYFRFRVTPGLRDSVLKYKFMIYFKFFAASCLCTLAFKL